MRTGTGRFGTSGPRDGSGDHRRADIYSDEELWRLRYDRAVDEATFWRNFALLRPFAVSSLIPVVERTVPLRAVIPRVAPQGVPNIPHQRTKHPAAAALAQRALSNSNNRGGRA